MAKAVLFGITLEAMRRTDKAAELGFPPTLIDKMMDNLDRLFDKIIEYGYMDEFEEIALA